MKHLFLSLIHGVYVYLLKPLLFLRNPESVHEYMTRYGQLLGKTNGIKRVIKWCLYTVHPILAQTHFGIQFHAPLGLAAGFDYEARLTGILPALDFGFGTVGTLTHEAYGGNPSPMLGRLPQSRSLMVNKGFKNKGVQATLSELKGNIFEYPVGISIGKTNSAVIRTQTEAIIDIKKAFKEAEISSVPFSYYELNISCPNLFGSVEFYEPQHLDELLTAVGTLQLSRPVFIKMPISKTDEEIVQMMEVIVVHTFVKAVILGNLQRDRNHPTLVKEEVERFSMGNFSGVPCRDRSDELIRLVFTRYGEKIRIIGCGGVFSGEDAYRKIALGASLVQVITGLVFEGPQLVAQIHHYLAKRLAREGRHNIQELIGSAL